MKQVNGWARELASRSSVAAVGFLLVIAGTVAFVAFGAKVPDAWWGIVGAATVWAWRTREAK